MSDTYQVIVYAEHCIRAGQRYWPDCDETDEDLARNHDVIVYEGSLIVLLGHAIRLATCAPGRANAFGLQAAHVICREIGASYEDVREAGARLSTRTALGGERDDTTRAF